jgi:hypothetical protein
MTNSTVPARGGGRTPWVVGIVLTVVAAALAAVTFAVVLPDRHRHQHQLSQVGLTSLEQGAVVAARQQMLNMLTLRRTSFDADWARAAAGATGSLAADLANQNNKKTLLQQMTTGKFDLQGQVTASGYEESSGNNYLVLVSASGYQVPDSGTRTLVSNQRVEITMTRVGGKWLASNFKSIGLI